jgi:hypothetical protein
MVLVIMLGFLGFKFYKVVTYSMDIPSEVVVDESQKSKDIDIKFKGKVPDKASFQIISRKNLFNPTRAASAPVLTTPKNGRTNYPKLFATIIRGSKSIAIIEDPDTKKTKAYRINDLVAGLLISEILMDRVILLSGEDKIEIKLRDDKGIKTSMPKTLAKQNIEQNKRKRPASPRRTPLRRRPVPSNNK